MTWIVIAAAAAVLIFLLIRTLSQYEHESASAALEQVAELIEITAGLEKRIENLEAIVTDVESEQIDERATPEGEEERGSPKRSRIRN